MNNELNGFPTAIKTDVIAINKSVKSRFSFIGSRIKSFYGKNKVNLKYLLFAIPIITTFLLLRGYQSWKTKAALHDASLSFQLQNWSLPPEHTFGVWVNSDYAVGFADVTVTFDSTKVKMTREASPSGSLARTIRITPMSEANSTGKVRVVLGLDPSQRASAPSQVFQIASLTFDANTKSQNVSTALTFDPASVQIVATDQSVFNITSRQNLNLTINPLNPPISNPVGSPTPTPTPRATRAPKPR